MERGVFCLLAGISVALAEITQFQMTECGSSRDVQFHSVSLTPMPVQIPGDIRLSVDASLTKTIGSSKMSLSIKRKTYFGVEVPMPCLFHIGSCTYDNLCTMVHQMITENWVGIVGGIGTQIQTMLSSVGVNASQCPQPPRNIRIVNYPISIPRIPAILTWFAAGDYHVIVKVNENDTGRQLVCLDLQLSVTQQREPSRSGWLFSGR
ncbi:ganglioside GM2 activator-like [Saccostrea echinata]|uniref:ganglioside GM2 activator-like n=1 Tax=Saccostrea echinata TaxID=191078 RepID=UPI002A83AF9E|nr:ganglioside GM2 activator-like [Saccostrea echinata]